MTDIPTFGRGGLNSFVDVDELVERIDLTDDEIAWRKEFVGFDEEDEQRLSKLNPLLRAEQDAIADDFYENLLRYEGTREIFERSPKDVEALKQTQRAYLHSLSTGEYDRAYFENRARVGKLHELLDMPLKYYVGQYGVYYDLLLDRLNDRVQGRVVEEIEEWAAEREAEDGGLGRLAGVFGIGVDDGGDDLERSFERTVRSAIDDGMMDVLSLLRIINLDLQVATDTYVDSYASRLEAAIERRNRLAAAVEADVRAPIDELHDASEVVAARAEAISSHAANQATAIEQSASEIGAVSAAIEEVTSVADDVRTESERAERLAADGADAADDALDELDGIERAAADVRAAVASLEAHADEISSVVARLDEIATQTSILAKNAEIEAARSGAGSETNRALRVIADEIDSFATRTRADLGAIEETAKDVGEELEETIETAEETVERVDVGSARIRETVASIETVHEAVCATAAGMDEVVAATDQQARSVQSIADSLDELGDAADNVAGAAESVAAASQEQTASLGAVSGAVERLTMDVEGDSQPVYERVK
ncbi:globin-coupled sensor protein [Halovivax gelatinilyticus]|uniref:globin-coupled sensor protein n=1 Tax=Halovivax gelatinilyticus TaxID=2961597 RepID=UPI0020CA3C6E|nr:globin-coupled sensor protein [Halovivax gelatinilyticus]